jgi:hypothetical protein
MSRDAWLIGKVVRRGVDRGKNALPTRRRGSIEVQSLERRTLLAGITSFTASPEPLIRPTDVTLTTTGAGAGFYRESNGVPGLQTATTGTTVRDTILGTGRTIGPDQWALVERTSYLSAGTYTYYAVNNGTTLTTTSTIQNVPPTMGALIASPDPGIVDGSVTLTATGVTDPDSPPDAFNGGLANVSFYRESNGVPGFQAGAGGDTLVATGISRRAIASTAGLGVGTYQYYAQAIDREGGTSAVVSTTQALQTPPPPPTAPSMPDLAPASDTGKNEADDITFDRTPTFTGTADPGATVQLYGYGLLVGTGAADASGAWAITADFSPGTWLVRATTAQFASRGIYSDPLTVTIDTDPPIVTVPAQPPPAAGAASFDLRVRYADARTALDAATLGDGDVIVSGPNGYLAAATFLGASPGGDDSPVIATYRVPAPGGTWNATDNGVYTVSVQADQVADVAGNVTAARAIGTMTVALVPPGPQRPPPVHKKPVVPPRAAFVASLLDWPGDHPGLGLHRHGVG